MLIPSSGAVKLDDYGFQSPRRAALKKNIFFSTPSAPPRRTLLVPTRTLHEHHSNMVGGWLKEK